MRKKKTEDEVVEKFDTAEAPENICESDMSNKGDKNLLEIPENVDKLLQIYSNYESLYVTERGFVYSPNTELSESTPAILYKNPYYNS